MQDLTDIGADIAVNTITEVFKLCIEGFKNADNWFKDNNLKLSKIDLGEYDKRHTRMNCMLVGEKID